MFGQTFLLFLASWQWNDCIFSMNLLVLGGNKCIRLIVPPGQQGRSASLWNDWGWIKLNRTRCFNSWGLLQLLFFSWTSTGATYKVSLQDIIFFTPYVNQNKQSSFNVLQWINKGLSLLCAQWQKVFQARGCSSYHLVWIVLRSCKFQLRLLSQQPLPSLSHTEDLLNHFLLSRSLYHNTAEFCM